MRRSLTAKQREELFAVGSIVRYAIGPTALFEIEDIFPGYGGSVARYYGAHCMGGIGSAYHEHCQIASDVDLRTWSRRKSFRRRT